ncbi:hypothetical protein PUR59_00985 [Streptomyces sp. SP18ES09]|uniref:hypothetical protein n=1 Tax=Streptomyces sp. SP18ES09 TaxID=3002532 RepID=UPI002E793B71|nr:hypothetical protein [Streptomyces sp. SP18ES09]MEE1813616.1 hypothetical protein [Streptomyces sp. SP18ES09]
MAIPGNFLSESTSTIEPNTAGWTPMLNSTLLRGTGGTAGDGTLQMRSVASGEMRCRTVASYPVLPGVEYAALADASGATVPERIGIRWLTAASVEISITWSLTTAAASASWHRIGVADYAPSTAAFAQIVLSSTPAAGSVNSFFDNIYLGLPQRTTGNLLAANVETSERAAGWEYTAGTNCSVSRTVPAVTWAPTIYTSGGHVATMTVTANGNADFRSTDLPPVIPGQQYLAFAHLNPPTSGTSAWIELRFYNAALTQIQATRAVLSASSNGWYRQYVSDFAPSTAAYATVAFGLTSATAGQVLRTDGAGLTIAPEMQAGTILPLSDGDFEAGIGTWAVASGVATIARTTPWGTAAASGTYSMTLASATATTSVIRSGRYPLKAQGTQRVQVTTLVAAGGWNIVRGIRWYDAGGVDLGVSLAASAPVPGTGWWRLTFDASPPVNATQAAVEMSFTATAPSSTVRIDKAALWQAVPIFELTPVEATGSVSIVLREQTVGRLLDLWRVTPDGTRTPVRGADGLIQKTPIVDTQIVVEDYEAPLGVPLRYEFEGYNVGSTTPITTGQSDSKIIIPPGDANTTWLKDPGHPQRNLRVLVKAAPSWQRPIVQGESKIRGRRNLVVLSDTRGGLEGDLVIWTRSDAERQQLHWLLDDGNTLLWQAAPGMGVDDIYVAVGQATEGRVTQYAQELWREWTLPLKQQDMPTAIGVAGSAGRTWQDVLTEHDTWGDVLSRYATWEMVLLNRPVSGG